MRCILLTGLAEPLQKEYVGFEALKEKIARRGGVRDPGAVAAAIGRKKYGKRKFQAAAARGEKMGKSQETIPPLHKWFSGPMKAGHGYFHSASHGTYVVKPSEHHEGAMTIHYAARPGEETWSDRASGPVTKWSTIGGASTPERAHGIIQMHHNKILRAQARAS